MDDASIIEKRGELESRKQEIEQTGRLLQTERIEKEKTLNALIADNEHIVSEIRGLENENDRKRDEIHDLQQTINNATREIENQKVELTKLSKRKRFIWC